MYITDTIKYVGVNDKTLDLFESQYIIPNGVSYNSYIIFDEKIVIMDTVDKRATDEWFYNIEKELNGKEPDYLVTSHLEPDHSANIKLISEKYPNMKLVLSSRAANMISQFFDVDLSSKFIVVNEADELDIGSRKLKFFMAPMVHWPEVMFTYDELEKVLFSADGFGKFGSLDVDEEWDCEARRYYFNIVGKYGTQVQAILKKAATLEIKIICPLHGPVLKENLEYYINKYDIWSSYRPEDSGILIAYTSIYGNTKKAVEKLADMLREKGENVVLSDLARDDIAETIEDAFRYDRMIIATQTHDAEVFPPADDFLRRLKHKNYQNRKVGIIENGSWAPMAGKYIEEILSSMKDIEICEQMITIKTSINSETELKIQELVRNIGKE